ncbi:MAG: hypothetical protein ACYDBP_02105 [Leptospirales bacterium]
METLTLPMLVDGLRRLLGLSYREVANSAEIPAPSNIREWVRGLPSRLSTARQMRVLAVVGIESRTGALRPGIHRWKVTGETLPLLPALLEAFSSPSATFSIARPRQEQGLFPRSALLLSWDEVRVILLPDGTPETEPASLVRHIPGASSPLREILLSGEEMTLLEDPALSPERLDALMPQVSRSTGEWTFERLFERLWAEGIEPAEAARRLGF